MHIIERIDKEMARHESETGKHCWAIYLGRDELKELLDWANENDVFETGNLEGSGRPQYNKALVYAVNDDTHINVS